MKWDEMITFLTMIKYADFAPLQLLLLLLLLAPRPSRLIS